MPSSTPPSAELLEVRLRNSRRLNVALAALSVFLLVVVFAVRSSDDSASPLSTSSGAADTEGDDTGGDGAGTNDPDNNDFGDPGRSFGDPDHPFVIGDPDAPVVLNEWIDLRCPFCAVFTNKSLPTLMTNYVEPGLVRIDVHPVSFFGDDSTNGAVALHAAADQDMFLEYMTTVFAAAPDKGHPDHPNDVLVDFARDAGIPDLDAFEAVLNDDAVRADVQAATAEAQRIGVQAVPFFVVGNQAISGAQPLEVFEALLDEATGTLGTTDSSDPDDESSDDADEANDEPVDDANASPVESAD